MSSLRTPLTRPYPDTLKRAKLPCSHPPVPQRLPTHPRCKLFQRPILQRQVLYISL